MNRPRALLALVLVAAPALALVSRGRAQEEGFRSPTWPHLIVSAPPDAWRVAGEGHVTRWRSVARLARLEDADLTGAETAERLAPGAHADDGSPAAARTLLRFEAPGGGSLDAAVPGLPKAGPLARALAAGQEVEVTLVHAQGFEGVARGLVVREVAAGAAGRLLLAYDDGGYGPALGVAAERDGMSVARVAIERRAGGGWQPVPVSFKRADDAVTVTEGATAALGRSGLAVTVVVSRAWAGPPPTDVDTTPLAWMLHRVAQP